MPSLGDLLLCVSACLCLSACARIFMFLQNEDSLQGSQTTATQGAYSLGSHGFMCKIVTLCARACVCACFSRIRTATLAPTHQQPQAPTPWGRLHTTTPLKHQQHQQHMVTDITPPLARVPILQEKSHRHTHRRPLEVGVGPGGREDFFLVDRAHSHHTIMRLLGHPPLLEESPLPHDQCSRQRIGVSPISR